MEVKEMAWFECEQLKKLTRFDTKLQMILSC